MTYIDLHYRLRYTTDDGVTHNGPAITGLDLDCDTHLLTYVPVGDGMPRYIHGVIAAWVTPL